MKKELEKLKEETGKTHYKRKNKKCKSLETLDNMRLDSAYGDRYWFRGEWRSSVWLEERLGIVENDILWGGILNDDGFNKVEPSNWAIHANSFREYMETNLHLASIWKEDLDDLINTIDDVKRIDCVAKVAKLRADIAKADYVTCKRETILAYMDKVVEDIGLSETELTAHSRAMFDLFSRRAAEIVLEHYPKRYSVD